MANVLVYIPAYGGQISVATFMSIHRMVPVLQQKGHSIAMTTSNSPDIEEVRNAMLTTWYDGMKQSSHILMIDADMGFPAEVVVDMLALNEPVVGAIYPKKSLEVQWAASGWGKHENAGGKGHFMKVRGLGAGCFLVRRDAVDQIIEKFPDIVDRALGDPTIFPDGRLIRAFQKCRNENGHLMSEDISFCYRWEMCGGTVWGAGGYEMEHVGPHSFKACYGKWADEKAAAAKLQAAE